MDEDVTPERTRAPRRRRLALGLGIGLAAALVLAAGGAWFITVPLSEVASTTYLASTRVTLDEDPLVTVEVDAGWSTLGFLPWAPERLRSPDGRLTVTLAVVDETAEAARARLTPNRDSDGGAQADGSEWSAETLRTGVEVSHLQAEQDGRFEINAVAEPEADLVVVVQATVDATRDGAGDAPGGAAYRTEVADLVASIEVGR